MTKTWGILAVLLFVSTSAFAQSLNLTLPDGCVEPSISAPVVPIASKDSRHQRILRTAVLIVGAGLDIHSTRMAMGVPGLVESHAWIYGRRPSLLRLVVAKSLINAPMLWLANQVAKKDPIDALMPVAISSAKQTYAAGMNYALIKQQRKANGGGL